MEYKTKVMRPANLRGLAAARQTIDTAIEDAEQKSVTGDLVLTVHLKDGSIVGVKQAVTKSIPLTERNA